MPIGDLTQIHFAAEGKNHADQRYLKNHSIDIGSTTCTASAQGADFIIFSGTTAAGPCSHVHFLRHRRTTDRRLDAGTRACLTGHAFSRSFQFPGRHPELCEQQSSGRTHYVLFHHCGRQELFGKCPGVRWKLCSLYSEPAGSQRQRIQRPVRGEQSQCGCG